MTRLTRRSVLRSVVAAGMGLTFAGPASAGEQARYVVTGSRRGVANRLESTNFAVRHALAGGRVCLVVGPEDDRGELENVGGVEEVARDLRFEFEEPAVEESGPESTDDTAAYSSYQWDKQKTEAFEAHETATGEGTRLAIIDTGIDHDHPDLAPNVAPGEGRSFEEGTVSEDTEYVGYHGTHVAGIVAAAGNGVVGTAPDAELVSLRVFYEDEDGNTVATFGDLLLAIDHAAGIDADAANMSVGTPPLPPWFNRTGLLAAFERVVQHATRRGTVVVASAGNAGANLQQGGFFTIPNSTAGAMSVSATAPNDLRAFYSNYGTNEIDVGAPGGGYETLEKTLAADAKWPYPLNLVLSTVPDGTYAWAAGTSMAAPQVTGAAALVRELDPDANARQVEDAIKKGADLVEGQSDPDLGAGRLNVRRTVESQ